MARAFPRSLGGLPRNLIQKKQNNIMDAEIPLIEKYERQGWPSLPRPDNKPPAGWSLELITSVARIYNHCLSPNGEQAAFLWSREGFADVYALDLRSRKSAWPVRVSLDRPNRIYWRDEIPQWSPDSQFLAYTSGDHVMVAPLNGGGAYPDHAICPRL